MVTVMMLTIGLSYLNEFLSDKIAQVIDVRVERIAPGCIPMLGC
jgi:hypothetical protein